MSFQISFPFCTISDLGLTNEVSGTISLSMDSQDPVTVEFSQLTKTWNTQAPDNSIVINMEDKELFNRKFHFTFSVTIADTESLVLLFEPTITHLQPVNTYLEFIDQHIHNTDVEYNQVWYNLPLKANQIATATVKLKVNETTNSVIDKLATRITYREELTYVKNPPTKSELSIVDNIEYYLGKDKLKNLYFSGEIPAAWSVPARIHTPAPNINSTAVGFFRGDTTEYYYNNLGYRSILDFVTSIDQPVILCLGDSDSFGVGVNYNSIWPSLVQQHTDAVVWNMSIPGISNDGITRIGVQTIKALGNQIDAVLLHYAPMSLREFVSKTYKGGVHTHRNYSLPYENWWDHIDWQSNNYNFNKNKLLLEHTCATYDIQYHDLYINRDDSKVPFDFVEYGVYSSLGPNTHQAISNYFIKKLNDEPSLFQQMQS